MGRRRYPRSTPIYEALFEELRRRACTQSEAARELGVSKQVVSNWISGRHTPSAEHARKLSTFLGVEPDDVLAMAQRAERVDRIAELERVQADLVREVAALRALLERAADSDGCEPEPARPARKRRASKP